LLLILGKKEQNQQNPAKKQAPKSLELTCGMFAVVPALAKKNCVKP